MLKINSISPNFQARPTSAKLAEQKAERLEKALQAATKRTKIQPQKINQL